MTTMHPVLKHPIEGTPGPGAAIAYFGMGCFWGAERLFWRVPGVWTTSVGYMGGSTEKPSYEEICTGLTGHAEVVRVVYEPAKVGFDDLLKVFWENHDPTQGMRQGNDIGTQYRSVVYTTTPEQQAAAEASREAFEPVVRAAGLGPITTAIRPAGAYWLAEDYHQQYLHHNPNGYCNHGPNGLSCPVGAAKAQTEVEPPRAR
ncbi:peptide-methionine (S)-S-oxide reductase MsrA [Glycomyces terrestris]|uniref:Peptide methionine sulfoxide reductase MsrA n=1 Tax=Glycomyces terrestris TaxID=2493553 RepID=A0A426UYX3_9ACTN|nr:peptide-methionine (S)-S-oxide reductase MsrA [Glycomyces terrestris]RRR99735.1 peptide-methionine (S)-S-oxide reductase MsrA [Glycomyces terrestris]